MSVKNRKRGPADIFSANDYTTGFDSSGSGSVSECVSGSGVPSPRKRVMRSHQSQSQSQQQQQPNPKYPETMLAFADGIKSDFFDIFSSGADALGSTVRMFFPMHSVDETTEDSLNDIEIKTPAQEPTVATPSKLSKLKSSLPSPSPLKQKLKESQAAIRMRCSNLWPEADNGVGMDSNASLMDMFNEADKGLDDATHGRDDGASKATVTSQAKKNNTKAQAGGKVLLSKLAKNTTIQYFPCGENDNKLVILGNLRMIHCEKNNDEQNTATIIWCEKFQEIASCVISCAVGKSSTAKAGKLESKLDITTRDDKKFSVVLEDAVLCIQVMQIIQKRCLPTSSSKSACSTPIKLDAFAQDCQQKENVSNESVDLLGLESMTSSEKDNSLTIGSSPMRTSTRRLANKRQPKTKLIVNIKKDPIENLTDKCKAIPLINRLPPPPAAQSAQVKNEEVNLIEFDEIQETSHTSPKKKMKVSHTQDVSNPCTPTAKAESEEIRSCPRKVVASSPAKSLSSPLPAKLKKYAVMIKTGIPMAAVRQKMTMEQMSAEDIGRICSETAELKTIARSPGPAPKMLSPQPSASTGDAIPIHLKKYKVMSKSGVPQPAIMQKMKLEGRSQEEINLVFGIKPKEISENLKKFQKMLKSGIPPGAVGQKMAMEGVSAEDQALVLGTKSQAAPSKAGPGPRALVISTAPSGPQLLGLHWDPIAENNDSLSTSMWGDIHAETPEQPTLQEKEFDSLSSMFSRKATPAKGKGGTTTAQSDRTLRSKSKMPTTIDMSRSTNISIGMSSFKQKKLTAENIVDAINSLDTSTLQHEDLLRLFEILPSDNEKKIFSGKMTDSRIEGFHDTEKWLHRLSAVENCSEKVNSMLFMTSFSQNSDATKKDLQSLVNFAERVVGSTALKEVMKCILAIGNTLNQGTYKGSARGFRLGSLLKLQQTKSTDGKCTVMDYLIQVLHSRYVTGDMKAGNALSLNDELIDVNQVKNINVTETSRDVFDMRKQFNKLKDMYKKISDAKDANVLIDTNFESQSNETFITNFISATEIQLQSLEELQKLLLASCDSITLFFGEEKGASVQHMYTMLAEFIAGYAMSKKKFEENLRKESRLKAAAAKKAELAASKK